MSSPRCRSELSDSAWVVIVPGQKCIKNILQKVLEDGPLEDRADKINITENKLPTIKTLRVCWIAAEVEFSFNTITLEDDFVFTKRNFLRKIATIFDPLGF